MNPIPSSHGHHDPHPNDHHTEKRDVKGSVTIDGETKVLLPRDITDEYVASSKATTSREKNRFTVELITLVFVASVAVLNLIQTNEAKISAEATRDAVAADWQVKMPLVIPWGIQPVWKDLPDGTIVIDMTQHINNAGDSAAHNLHMEWGWGNHELHQGEYQWKSTAWEGATIAQGPGVYDSRNMTLDEAKMLAQLPVWYECGHLTWEDRFPIRPDLGHMNQLHSGKWCIRLKNFHLEKGNTHWDANVTCTDSQCDHNN